MLELSRSCIPYTPLKRELKDCRIALVSTSGAYVEGMQPFGENERKLKEVVSWEIAEAVMKMRPSIVVLTGG